MPIDPIEADMPTLSEESGVRYLHFNSEWVQGAMRVAKPSELVLAYTRQMMAWLIFMRPGAKDTLGILGLGAGSLLRFCLRHTRSQIETIERNPRVTAMCQVYFRLPQNPRAQIFHADARDWVADKNHYGRYAVLMADLYDSEAQGPVCGEPEFYLDCRRALADDGILVVNLFGNHASFSSNLAGIAAAFDDCYICLPEIDEGNTVVLAFASGEDLPSLLRRPETESRAIEVQARTGLPAPVWLRTFGQ